jgi:hypothetical protein
MYVNDAGARNGDRWMSSAVWSAPNTAIGEIGPDVAKTGVFTTISTDTRHNVEDQPILFGHLM